MFFAILNRFLNWLVIGLISPIMVLMILSKGVPLEKIGLIMAMISTFVVAFELPCGILSDHIGRKKIYLLSLALFSAAFTIILTNSGFLAMGIGSCLFGLARACSSGSIESDFIDGYIAKHGQNKLHRIIAGMSLGETAGLAIGALVGGYLPSIWQVRFPGANMYDGNLIAQLATLGLLFLLTLFFHETAAGTKREELGRFLLESMAVIKSNRVIATMLLGAVIWGFSFNTMELYWQPRLKGILADDRSVWIFGVINSGYFMAAMIGAIAAGSLISRLKASMMPIIGAMRILVGLSMIMLAFQDGLPGFSLWFLLAMGFNGMAGVPESAALNARIPSARRSSFLSLSSLTMQIGAIIASLTFGFLKEYASIGQIWIVAGTLFGVSSILYFPLARYGISSNGRA